MPQSGPGASSRRTATTDGTPCSTTSPASTGALEPGDELLDVYLGVRDGHGQGWAVVRIEGAVCPIPVSDEWLGVRPDTETAA